MYDTIVVGTDGSATAGVAVQEAIDLAQMTGATLHLVHAYRLVSAAEVTTVASAGGPMVDFESLNEGLEKASDETLAAAIEQAERVGVKAEGHSCPGDAAEALVAVAETKQADLMVVGNRGMTGMRRFMLGSVPNKVSHHCPCSLLIVDTTV
ncbi:MAG: UspA domain protein [Actinomycetia bacterium]|jgi:nucleotide-binding universal stress UspA family protein|nr:UspA domain protein [Actinomycetes bacterium]